METTATRLGRAYALLEAAGASSADTVTSYSIGDAATRAREIEQLLPKVIPATLTAAQQGEFMLGYCRERANLLRRGYPDDGVFADLDDTAGIGAHPHLDATRTPA